MAKEKLPTIVSPACVFAFAWLSKPDTGGKYSDDKYKVTGVFDPAQPGVKKFLDEIEAAHTKARGKKKTDSPVKDGNEKKDKEGNQKEEFKGKFLLTFKSKYPPQLLGKGNVVLSEVTAPKSGDVGQIAFAALPYEEGKNAGISLQLRAVKVTERRAGADYSSVFGMEEGEEPEETPAKGDDEGKAKGDF